MNRIFCSRCAAEHMHPDTATVLLNGSGLFQQTVQARFEECDKLFRFLTSLIHGGSTV